MEESVDSVQESLSSMESQPCSLAVNDSAVQSEDKPIALSENSDSTVATKGAAETPDKSNEEGDGPKSSEPQPGDAKNTVQSNPSKKANRITNTEPKNDCSKRDRGDQNENVELEANQAEKKQHKKKNQLNKVTPAAEQNPWQLSSWSYLT